MATSAHCENNDQEKAIQTSWEQLAVYREVGYKDGTVRSIAYGGGADTETP